jgi:hypothetical protein
MFRPHKAAELEEWVESCRALARNPAYAVHKQHIERTLEQLDTANRIVGQENKVSGAQVLAAYLEEVAACCVPEADRNRTNESGTEGESAAYGM